MYCLNVRHILKRSVSKRMLLLFKNRFCRFFLDFLDAFIRLPVRKWLLESGEGVVDRGEHFVFHLTLLNIRYNINITFQC